MGWLDISAMLAGWRAMPFCVDGWELSALPADRFSIARPSALPTR